VCSRKSIAPLNIGSAMVQRRAQDRNGWQGMLEMSILQQGPACYDDDDDDEQINLCSSQIDDSI